MAGKKIISMFVIRTHEDRRRERWVKGDDEAWCETKEHCWLKEAEVSVMSFILEGEAAAGHFSHFLIVSSLQKGIRFLILSRLSCPLHHPAPLPTILQVIIWFHDPQQPRWSNHLDHKWGSGSTSPVVLFLSSPVSLIIAKSSIPVSLGLGETKNPTTQVQTSAGIQTKVLPGQLQLLLLFPQKEGGSSMNTY